MIKTITALALTGFTSLGFASSAAAHHVKQQPYNSFESRLLMEAVVGTGHTLRDRGGPCDIKGLKGAATSKGELYVCVANHGGNQSDMADTLRHEAIHLAQRCKARRHGATDAILQPHLLQRYFPYAVGRLHWDPKRYSSRDWPYEAEATVLAHELDEHHIAQLLVKECGPRPIFSSVSQ